ncbi:MAG: methyl-accepting chemotaxis protein [Roseburia sp.]|nr:methyl-accepting chemotaxis protein [Roseburia sp.]
MKLTEKGYCNKWVVIGHGVIDSVLFAAYTLEFIKGSRTLPYLLIMAAFTILPVVVELICYKRNKESNAIKYIVGVTYSAMYVFVLFTTNSILPFTYAFPMYVVITLYSDVLFCLLVALAGMLANIANIVYIAVSAGYRSEELPDLEIRIACTFLVGGYMVLTTYANRKISDNKLGVINEKNEATTRLLNKIMGVSNEMIENIGLTTEKIDHLGESVSHIHDSMGEVSQGSTETAESVQKQLEQTESIQNYIATVKDTTENIEKNMSETTQMVEEGRKKMDTLAEQVEKSMKANELVLSQMEELNEYTRQMNTIIETITSIANSTGMLALNASIEAARAGEAGRGFAVVADEISGLANQTKTATINITELIENINQELVGVVSAVNVVTQSNQENAKSTTAARDNFAGIAEGTENIGRQTAQLAQAMESLEAANRDIVDKIQTISAITEEVSAHANETYEACEDNSNMVQEVTDIVRQLNEDAQRLKQVNA